MGILQKIAELEFRLLVAKTPQERFEEYKKLHPKTKKTPSDPMFAGGKREPKQKDVGQATQSTSLQKDPQTSTSIQSIKEKSESVSSEPESLDTQIKKPTAEMTEDELITKYTPKFSGGEFQKKLSYEEFEKNLDKMSGDDFAWHMVNGDKKFMSSFEQGNAYKKFMDWPQVSMLMMFNKSVNKKNKDNMAYRLIDKAGVSFVGGRTLGKFIQALASKGILSKSSAKQAEEDSLRNDVYYGGISDPDEIRKLAKVKDRGYDEPMWYYQLKNNPYTPSDVLQNMAKHYLTKVRGNGLSSVEEVIRHKNFPISELIDGSIGRTIFGYLGREALDKILYNREDCPAEVGKRIIDQRIKGGGYQPPKFEISESNFLSLWKNGVTAHTKELEEETAKAEEYKKKETLEQRKERESRGKSLFDPRAYPTSMEYALDDYARHPKCPENVLRDILAWKKRPYVSDDGEDKLDAIDRAKKFAYKNLMERNLIKPDEIKKEVAEKLNLHGDIELIMHMGEQAFLRDAPIKNSIKRTITKVSDADKKAIEQEMSKTAVHDDFDFEVVNAYEIDQEPHHDFDETSKRIGNVKQNIYHGTSFGNAAGILSEGVLVGGKSRTGQMFGEGFYLASASSKAVQYASENFSKNNGDGIVFVLDAALGKSKEMKYGRPREDDLRNGYLNEDEEKSVEEFKEKHGRYPKTKWHLTHDSVEAKAGMMLDHDEYVVKDPSQIKVRRILHVRKKPKVKNG